MESSEGTESWDHSIGTASLNCLAGLGPKGACKYYISALGVGGGSEENAYFAYVVRGGGGSRGKMLILLM